MTSRAADPVLWNDWHVVAEVEGLRPERPRVTYTADARGIAELREAVATLR